MIEDDRGLLFYRCTLCRSVVSQWDIEEHAGCPKCRNPRVSPSELTVWEKIVQVVKHPAVWRWGK